MAGPRSTGTVCNARPAGPWTTLAEPPALAYTAIGLTNGTSYSFRIAAHNASGWGPYSTVVNAVPRTVPTAPLSPVATPANASVKLSWTKPASTGGAAISHYVVQRSSNGINGWTNVGYPAGTSYTALGLINGAKYYFRVRAYNPAGWSPFSTVVSAVPRTVPSAPLSPFALPGDGFATVYWKAPSNNGGAAIDGYVLQRSSNGIDGWTNAAYTNADHLSAQSPSGQYVIVTWQPPLSNGGAPITSYEVSLWRNGVNVDIVSVYPCDPQVGVLTPRVAQPTPDRPASVALGSDYAPGMIASERPQLAGDRGCQLVEDVQCHLIDRLLQTLGTVE